MHNHSVFVQNKPKKFFQVSFTPDSSAKHGESMRRAANCLRLLLWTSATQCNQQLSKGQE